MSYFDMKDIVKQYDTTDNMFVVDGLPIHLDYSHSNISVDLSGGADSALLSYLLISELNRRKQKCTVHLITHRRLWKTRPWQKIIAKNVFDYLCAMNTFLKQQPLMSSLITIVRHTNFIPPLLESVHVKGIDESRTAENLCVDEFREVVMFDYDIDMIYNATTLNPPMPIEGRVPSRDKTKIDKLDLLNRDDKESNPFFYINKAWVIKQYKDNNILDLLYTTRSCEGGDVETPADWNGERPDDCGECFWCVERHWAMDENNVEH